ncbi:leucine/isoleucine/valine transporter permease subunit [compost metagenome]|jgi:branched-chain amino acid transport system permease protein|uniref:High-affinity branched-chain amino acid ABC transporter permease LivM n=2 Tax=Agrobacterium tumefaciens complex TaxID=1183400 RepID=A0AAP4YQ44_AGRTU|nr:MULTISPECIES: high-affinity branched-chain amino acid ABC transporter permease LivM [Agrobacterium tumefaciens complex]MCP2133861.1 branched-chain amino acid transport system permease protein [Rhizobium sp. SLBN-94]TGE80783.1 branched-chain amino acid ABC transporter permease [Rhizobium sp. SEMIA 439]EPR19253.1 ABC transporter permease [Agrobacterium radiobacter DSM 30147]KAA1237675.1 high-affinity branched-chain amino acid ABC transporter permease LivM [Agrobacterium tumefaciens]KAB0460416
MTNIASENVASSPSLMATAVKEGLIAGLISFGMFILYVGIVTYQDINNQLIWGTRWGLLAIFVGIAAVGRFLVVGFIKPSLDRRRLAKAKSGILEISEEKGFFHKHFLKLALVLLLLYPVIAVQLFGFQGSLKFVDNFGIQILIYVMLAWGLNIVVGLAGLLDLGYVAFYAVGAYSYALLSSHFGLSFWVLLPVAGILAGFWGIILGFPVLRLRGDYLAIVTLAFGEIIRLVLLNWTAVTKGTFGISGIAKASVFGIWSFDVAAPNNFAKAFGLSMSSAYYKIFLFYVILLLCMLTAYVTIKLRRMPIGRAWEALREDEIACRSLGIDTVITKLTAFATGAMFGGFAGSFFAARQGFVSPESFVFLESAVILAIVVLGGMGSLTGIAIAALVMVGGTELLREMEFLKHVFGPDFTPELYRMLLFGLAMVIVMLFKPRGFVGSREPTAFLKERKAVSGSFTKEGHG